MGQEIYSEPLLNPINVSPDPLYLPHPPPNIPGFIRSLIICGVIFIFIPSLYLEGFSTSTNGRTYIAKIIVTGVIFLRCGMIWSTEVYIRREIDLFIL